MTDTTIPTFYTLASAHLVLGDDAPSVRTLRREIARGNLRAKRIGRCLRVTDVELRRWALDVDPSPTGESSRASAVAAPPRSLPGGESDNEGGNNGK